MKPTLLTRRQALGAVAAPLLAQKQSRPNILFILVDDLKWDALGCTGHAFAKTPNIDRIAREGARFQNAYVTTSLCSPSRASFLTGRYVHAHGVKGNGDNAELSHKLVTFPKLLHDSGYETGFFGKWHMGNDDTPRPGFDRWVVFKGQGQYNDPPLNIDGKAEKVAGYITDILTDHTVEFLKRERTKPFCAYLSHKAIHGPFTPPERYKTLYSDQPITRNPAAKDTLEGKPALTRLIDGSPAVKAGGGSNDDLIRNQLRCVAAIDEGVGRILKTLEETRQLDNTLFVFTSDNGYYWGEHGLGDKRWGFEDGILIPMLMRYPKLIKKGFTTTAPVLNIDMAPTFLDLAGVKAPGNMHGRSVLPLFKSDKKWRQSFLFEYFAEGNFPRVPTYYAVRTREWKYVHYSTLEGMDELYNLTSDPNELKNVIKDPANQKHLAVLKADMERQIKETV